MTQLLKSVRWRELKTNPPLEMRHHRTSPHGAHTQDGNQTANKIFSSFLLYPNDANLKTGKQL